MEQSGRSCSSSEGVRRRVLGHHAETSWLQLTEPPCPCSITPRVLGTQSLGGKKGNAPQQVSRPCWWGSGLTLRAHVHYLFFQLIELKLGPLCIMLNCTE